MAKYFVNANGSFLGLFDGTSRLDAYRSWLAHNGYTTEDECREHGMNYNIYDEFVYDFDVVTDHGKCSYCGEDYFESEMGQRFCDCSKG